MDIISDHTSLWNKSVRLWIVEYRVAHLVTECSLLTSKEKYKLLILKFNVNKRLSVTRWATLYLWLCDSELPHARAAPDCSAPRGHISAEFWGIMKEKHGQKFTEFHWNQTKYKKMMTTNLPTKFILLADQPTLRPIAHLTLGQFQSNFFIMKANNLLIDRLQIGFSIK